MARRRGGRSGFFSHRRWIAIESVLAVGLLKDWTSDQVLAASLPNWAKVGFVMAATVGILGGLFYLVERLTRSSVAHTYAFAKRAPVALPSLLLHVGILAALFLIYARTLELPLP